MDMTFKIPFSKYERLQKRFEKARKKSRKHGLPSPIMTLLGETRQAFPVYDPLGALRGNPSNQRNVYVRTAEIAVSNLLPPKDDWTFTAARYGSSRSAKLPRKAYVYADRSIPEHLEKREICCEHCDTKRQRNISYILNHQDGRYVEVGSTCLGAFLGLPEDSPYLSGVQDNFWLYKEITDAANETPELSSQDVFDEVDLVLTFALSVIKRDGYYNKHTAPSRDKITWLNVMNETMASRHPDNASNIVIDIEDFLKPQEIMEWAKAKAKEPNNLGSDYWEKVSSILENGLKDRTDFAILTALTDSYNRNLAYEARMKKKESEKDLSGFIGVLKERKKLKVRVESISSYETRFGVAYNIVFDDPEGNKLRWSAKTSNHKLNVGHEVDIIGTIERHEVGKYGMLKDVNVTELKRVSLERDYGQCPPYSHTLLDNGQTEQERFVEVLEMLR